MNRRLFLSTIFGAAAAIPLASTTKYFFAPQTVGGWKSDWIHNPNTYTYVGVDSAFPDSVTMISLYRRLPGTEEYSFIGTYAEDGTLIRGGGDEHKLADRYPGIFILPNLVPPWQA